MTITAELRLLVKALETTQKLVINQSVRNLISQMISMVDKELAQRHWKG